MTVEQANLLRKATKALFWADANLRAATNENMLAAAGEYLNARRAHDQAYAAAAASVTATK